MNVSHWLKSTKTEYNWIQQVFRRWSHCTSGIPILRCLFKIKVHPLGLRIGTKILHKNNISWRRDNHQKATLSLYVDFWHAFSTFLRCVAKYFPDWQRGGNPPPNYLPLQTPLKQCGIRCLLDNASHLLNEFNGEKIFLAEFMSIKA